MIDALFRFFYVTFNWNGTVDLLADETTWRADALSVMIGQNTSWIVSQAHAFQHFVGDGFLPVNVEINDNSSVNIVPFVVNALRGQADVDSLGKVANFFQETQQSSFFLFGFGCQDLHAVSLTRELGSRPVQLVLAHVQFLFQFCLALRNNFTKSSIF